MIFSRVTTIDQFYTQSAAIWRQLDSLRTAVCGTCPCCRTVRSDLEFQRIYEFLSRLRQEFEPRRAQLFARGRIPISEVLSELRAEETRLRGAGLLAVPSVLAARGPATPTTALDTSCLSAPAPILSPTNGGGRPCRHCDYCGKPGHIESDCFKKMRDMSRGSFSETSGTRAPTTTPSTVSVTEQDIVRLQGLLRQLLASGSSSTGSAGLVANSSSSETPPSSQPGVHHGSSGWFWPSPP